MVKQASSSPQSSVIVLLEGRSVGTKITDISVDSKRRECQLTSGNTCLNKGTSVKSVQ